MCGASPTELEHLREKRHTYSVYRFPIGTEMVLCDSCFLDMDSIGGEHWGLPVRGQITTNDLSLVRDVADPQMVHDKYCPNCAARLSYLESLQEIVAANNGWPQSQTP